MYVHLSYTGLRRQMKLIFCSNSFTSTEVKFPWALFSISFYPLFEVLRHRTTSLLATLLLMREPAEETNTFRGVSILVLFRFSNLFSLPGNNCYTFFGTPLRIILWTNVSQTSKLTCNSFFITTVRMSPCLYELT